MLLCLLNSCQAEFTSGVSKHVSSGCLALSTHSHQSHKTHRTFQDGYINVQNTLLYDSFFLRQTQSSEANMFTMSFFIVSVSAADTIYFRVKQNILTQSVLISSDVFPFSRDSEGGRK